MVSNMKKKYKQTKKGFTLIEMIISIFIFLIMMIAIVQIFAQQIQAYRHARSVQNDMENAQFAMNYIAKTLRTATVLGGTSVGDLRDYMQSNGDFDLQDIQTGEGLIVYDFSQEKCVQFTFRGPHGTYPDAALWVVNNSGTISYDEIDECLDVTNYDYTSNEKRLTTGDVTGTFQVAPTRYQNVRGSRQTDTIGRVTTAMKVLPGEGKLQRGTTPVPIYLQTTASLRDYPPDLSF